MLAVAFILLLPLAAASFGAGSPQQRGQRGPPQPARPAADEPPLVGAIRWDAYFDWQAAQKLHGDTTAGVVGKTTQYDMSPPKYHFRVPFFGEEINSTAIVANGDTDDAMAQELEYAASHGIKFWSFCNYPIGCTDYSAGKDEATCPKIQCCADNYALS